MEIIIGKKRSTEKGLRVSIGNGFDTKTSMDPWLPTIPARPPHIKSHINPHTPVSYFIDQGMKEWNMNKVTTSIETEDITLIRSFYLARTNT